jgi:hypothetical protein
VTGVQAAQVAFAALLEAWRQQMSPREYEVLLDLMRRRLERELEGGGKVLRFRGRRPA